ncbi:MAG TPA: ABC transporter permease [Anaerolineae bacterium]|nr:ABC transporter permease [Anaerolineae bacterium]HPL28134.1 ABC transporter permease [Anaerolineae bacterium]
MTTFIIRRVLQSVVVLLLVSLLIFLAIRLLPGDPIYLLVFENTLSGLGEEEIAQLRHEFGLDRPMPVQYLDWLVGVFRGDLGTSIFTRAPVAKEIFRRLPITFEIGMWSIVLSAVIGVPLGIVSAVRRGQWMDQLVVSLSNVGITIPVFWLGLILMLVFGLHLGWLPVMGYTPLSEDVGMHFRRLVMPVICSSIGSIAAVARQTRSSMLEVIHQDYVRTARAKGLTENVIILKHALSNGLIPVITTIGLSIRGIVGGSTVIETVFSIPGMGRLLVNAVQSQDYAFVQGIILIIAAVVVLANLLIELAYAWADPRIRFQ